MKLLIAASVLSSLSVAAEAAAAASCTQQAACMEVEIKKVSACGNLDENCGAECTYEVCWRQTSGDGCDKTGSFSHIGDMYGTDQCKRGGINEWQWDSGCESPPAPFENCQKVLPGQWVHFLAKDGGGCSTDPTPTSIFSTGDVSVEAFCNPTGTGIPDNQGGSTWYPNDKQTDKGGTCSGNAIGVECVWAVQVPNVGCDACDDPQPTDPPSGSNGDPHFKTWKNEHFEYHGQCDLVLAKDETFADDIGLDVQIRTKVVRYWSYIKNAAIRIGNDILEVEGGPETDATNHYWYNLEYQGKIQTLGGFPVTYHQQSGFKRRFEIDLSSKYPGQKIVVSTYKEFVRVDFENGTEAAFGKTKGLLGDFKTGATLARDGTTVLNDFWEYGNEWQVLPFEHMLFHETSDPQFPERCIQPEDPRGERRRKLSEATVTEAQAEAACAHLKDPLDRKDCLYDVLATQDLDMVGAY